MEWLMYTGNSCLQTHTITYIRPTDKSTKEAIIYSTPYKQNKLIMILNGNFQFYKSCYIQKTVEDLYPHVKQTHQIIVYENHNIASIELSPDIAQYIKNLHETQPLHELVLFGFSAGGCVASHVMSELKSTDFSKKLILYDTPLQVKLNVESYSQNWFYRPDILYYWMVQNIYSNYYKPVHWNNQYYGYASEFIKQIQTIHGYSDEEFLVRTGYNTDQPLDTSVLLIQNKYDPIVNPEVQKQAYHSIMEEIDYPIRVVQKNTIGHCSDMWWSTDYLHPILNEITGK
jgi:hypothetical protein